MSEIKYSVEGFSRLSKAEQSKILNNIFVIVGNQLNNLCVLSIKKQLLLKQHFS